MSSTDIVPPVSNSEFKTWERCRRKWYLQHYRSMAPKARPVTGALSFGTRIHDALDRHYTTGVDPRDVYEEHHAATVAELDARLAATGFDDEDQRKKLQAERELAHAMLEGFLQWSQETGLDEGLELIGAEVVVEVASGIPGVRIRGKLDQKVRREIDGAVMFRDWKTAANLTDGPRLLPLDEQMKMYQLLDHLAGAGEMARGGLYTMLKKVKRTGRATPPFYGVVEVRNNRRALESMWLRIHRRLNEMLEARDQLDRGFDHRYWTPPNPTKDCTWDCPFFRLCPSMDDSPTETWEAMLDAEYERFDPYERYETEDAKGD